MILAAQIAEALQQGQMIAKRTARGEVVRLYVYNVVEVEVAHFASDEAFRALMGLGTLYEFNAEMFKRKYEARTRKIPLATAETLV